ncbi:MULTISPECIES: sulfite exporter TauE/SafE family protein [Brevibacillus]|uniref:sulfite exporter TauE/SafE family protein n=1 Tax=Brevibacillus TaxID=55080 RepID=UPI0009DB25FF|nr:sulfite exporter TauE/SafE family protein [Brevibacillus borstelensis]MCC0565158.1 sulfite exporter TauE/SafE family protein [Brevibacillus borstelensis]NOU53768.1 sulfite exporter TauE/SafE family protein [Brevibacillus borstelensis]
MPHARAGHVRWKTAVIFAILGAIGAYFGSFAGTLIPENQLLFLFSISMMSMAVRMSMPKKKQEEASAAGEQVNVWRAAVAIYMLFFNAEALNL